MKKDFSVSVVIVAAGRGTRAGLDMNKVYVDLKGQPVLVRSILPFLNIPQVRQIIVTISESDRDLFDSVMDHAEIRRHGEKISTATGGATRQESVYNGLLQTDPDCSLVAVHDAARPLIDENDIYRVFEKALEVGGACLGVKVKDTVKRVDSDLYVVETLKREELIAVQTPQVFKRDIIIDSYEKALLNHVQGSDDATLAEWSGYKVMMIQGSYDNIKITTPEDFHIAERLLEQRRNS